MPAREGPVQVSLLRTQPYNTSLQHLQQHYSRVGHSRISSEDPMSEDYVEDMRMLYDAILR